MQRSTPSGARVPPRPATSASSPPAPHESGSRLKAAAPLPPATPLGASRPAPTKQRVIAELRREALWTSSPELAFAALVLEEDAGATPQDIKISHAVAIEPLAIAIASETRDLLESFDETPQTLVFRARSLNRQARVLALVARHLEAAAMAIEPALKEAP